MKENQVKRRMYITPQIEIARIKMSCHLLEASYPGQHNPAQPGGTSGDAKKAFDWMDEDENEDEDETPSWNTNRE